MFLQNLFIPSWQNFISTYPYFPWLSDLYPYTTLFFFILFFYFFFIFLSWNLYMYVCVCMYVCVYMGVHVDIYRYVMCWGIITRGERLLRMYQCKEAIDIFCSLPYISLSLSHSSLFLFLSLTHSFPYGFLLYLSFSLSSLYLFFYSLTLSKCDLGHLMPCHGLLSLCVCMCVGMCWNVLFQRKVYVCMYQFMCVCMCVYMCMSVCK